MASAAPYAIGCWAGPVDARLAASGEVGQRLGVQVQDREHRLEVVEDVVVRHRLDHAEEPEDRAASGKDLYEEVDVPGPPHEADDHVDRRGRS